jgi:1-acyl-sn-glycerol-3-phosphate acyltransferase
MSAIELSPTRSLSQTLAHSFLNILGWKVEANLPPTSKYVMIGAHHTSNIDFPLTLLVTSAMGIKLNWIGKDSLFRRPFGGLMRSLGGIPVDRFTHNKFVDQMIAAFHKHPEFVVAISPEGTRKKTDYWRTGFYYIALGAKVPIALSYLDYRRKVGGIGTSLMPSGDIQADMDQIREFYVDVTGKFPHQQGEVQIRPR